MNDLTNTLRDIARTPMLDHITDGPMTPEEEAEYLTDMEELEKQNQEWWRQQDEDEQYIQDHDFAEYQGEER